MNNSLKSAVMALGLTLSAVAAGAETSPHWAYSGAAGPEHWGELSPAFSACAQGKNQSPVNLSAMVEGDLPAIQFDYQAGGSEVLNNGHAIQVNYQPGSQIRLDGKVYELKQFHFHSPSENAVEGQQYPLEAHLVHADSQGNLAVVAVMFHEGESNPALEPAWSRMPQQPEQRAGLDSAMNALSLLPADKDYYRFSGSLTTPPCSEGVIWLVMKASSTVSEAQIKAFTAVLKHPNNRPVQPVNARLIVK